jgi:hypothetical protein
MRFIVTAITVLLASGALAGGGYEEPEQQVAQEATQGPSVSFSMSLGDVPWTELLVLALGGGWGAHAISNRRRRQD